MNKLEVMDNRENEANPLPRRWVGCDIEEEYFGDDRKLSKQARKFASSKDRSKYKKTDRDRIQKQSMRKERKNLLQGRVLSIVTEGAIVDYQGEKFTCSLRGILKKERGQHKNLITVGDFVLFEKRSFNEGSIAQVEPRHSILSRADNLSRRKEQIIAANIDQVLITVSVVEPPLKTSLIDRYIIAAQKGNMVPLILINKIDLFEEESDLVKTQKEIFDEVVRAYTQVGINVIPLSAATEEGIDTLKEVMKDKASVFSGQSGVGKSSLINAVTGMDLAVGDIVEKTKKGAHTTSTTNLLHLDFGGWCIDTPGIKSFGVWDLKKEEVEHYFSEIFEYGRGCKFPDCTHTHEAGCAVQLALEKEQISPLRYDSYIALMESVAEAHLRR